MLWDLVFEFFVTHIFGGVLGDASNYTVYQGTIGRIQSVSGVYAGGNTAQLMADTFKFGANGDYHLPLGNYLSLIATIITMIIILVLCCLFIKKIISLMGKLFSGGTL